MHDKAPGHDIRGLRHVLAQYVDCVKIELRLAPAEGSPVGATPGASPSCWGRGRPRTGPVPGCADSRQAADGFLAAHPPLKPDWPNAVQVGAGAQGQKVFYLREFELSAAQPGQLAAQVDGAGSPAGLSVDVAGGSVTGATGPLPLALESSDYRSRTAQQATADALAAPQGTGPRPADIPSIQLSKVSLVYIAAGTDQYGYFLPAYLFTGTITTRGQTLEKRVLVPAVS